jgi:hypothetical protein
MVLDIDSVSCLCMLCKEYAWPNPSLWWHRRCYPPEATKWLHGIGPQLVLALKSQDMVYALPELGSPRQGAGETNRPPLNC